MSILFDIILPTYNNCNELLNCLTGFESQTEKDFRLLICIDGSTDGTQESVQAYCLNSGMNIVVLEHPDGMNHGRNATRNLALPLLNAPYVICLDSDAIPSPDFLANHLSILEQHECVSAGDLNYVNADTNRWAAYLHTRGKKRFANNAQIPFQYITTGNLGMPTRFFQELNGQDAAMKGYGGGDTEFAYRLHKTFNPKIYHAKSAIAESFMQKSIDEALNQMEEFGRGNLQYIRTKHPEFTELFRLNVILKQNMQSRLIRMLLHPLLGNITQRLAKILPMKVAIALLPHAVMSRIWKGLNSVQ